MIQSDAHRRQSLFGVKIDALSLTEAVAQLADWTRAPYDRCRFVVTPNVDHTVQLHYDRAFRKAYAAADLVLADGWPVVWAARLLGRPLPGLAPGSDLTPALFQQHRGPQPLRVFLLGGMSGVAERAAANIESKWPQVEVVGVDSPPLGFEYSQYQAKRICDKISASAPDVVVVGFGAPKQEQWVYRNRRFMRAKVVLCVGATIDFLAGEKQRAPRWMRSAGVEWLHRVISEPSRLARRYWRDAREYPALVVQQWKEIRRDRTRLANAAAGVKRSLPPAAL